ncbi:hypothetical protein BFJ68_g16625 [Fusarium oxysporum]|uniref:Uncharacterized protein n=1 Tax=Fusarium oxysporum TaxID=5507 RepID=A0A420PBB6_FUSOX|nr:hypothetical protein BFJ68_g16625 [Fusarium oxysporum]
MSFATTGFDVLNRLALRIDPDAKVLICCQSTCRYALSVKGSAVTTHLRVKHQVEHDERKGLTKFLKGLGQSYLGDPVLRRSPKTAARNILTCASTRGKSPEKRELDEFYDEVWLQAWTAGSNQSRRYWIVSRGGLAIRTSDAIQAHLTSIKEQERLLKLGKDTSTHTESGGIRTNSQGDLLRFEEQTLWIERTGWDKTYHGRSRDVLRQYRSLEAPGLIFLVAKGPTVCMKTFSALWKTNGRLQLFSKR